MPPIRDLATLLAGMQPVLNPRPVAIVGLDSFAIPDTLAPEAIIGTFREAAGLTLYVDLAAAEAAGLEASMRAAWVTLNAPSALDAVGFTAAFSAALARAGIPCNVVAGARLDHLFVPLEQAEEAMRTLREVQAPQGAQLSGGNSSASYSCAPC